MKRMKKLLAFALCVWICGGVLLSAFPVTVNAETVSYTDVLEDLQKDPKFDATKYPAKADDTSVSLIQIAESSDNQLFLYVYQPSDATIDLKCKSVSIHIGYSIDGAGLDPKLYDLKLVSENGVFDKYLVNGFALPKEAYRYYNVVSLYREYNKVVDGDSGVVTTEKGYAVGQQWCAYTLNDRRVYEMNTFNTMPIEYTVASKVKFANGITWGSLAGYSGTCQAHFIAFNCEAYKIQHIFDANLSYTMQEWHHMLDTQTGMEHFTPTSEVIPVNKRISDEDVDKVSYEGKGLFSRKFSWNRIMSAGEYKQILLDHSISLTSEEEALLDKSQWVFCFEETPFESLTSGGVKTEDYMSISDISVLRIHFQDISGNVYDLGVVSDKVVSTGSFGSSEGVDSSSVEEYREKVLFWLSLIAGAVIITFFFGPVVTMCKMIFSCFVALFQVVWWCMSLPFRVLKRLLSSQ